MVKFCCEKDAFWEAYLGTLEGKGIAHALPRPTSNQEIPQSGTAHDAVNAPSAQERVAWQSDTD